MTRLLFLHAVFKAADKCLLALKRVKTEGTNRKRKAKEEVSSLFRKKGGRSAAVKCVWKHRFVCLAYCDQYKIPTTDVEKDDLLQAGLGEKEIEFESLDLDADEFRKVLFNVYPQLETAGGFQFFKCVQNSRRLEPLSTVTLSSPGMLKSRVGNSRTYIRPIQKDLDLSAVFNLPKGVRHCTIIMLYSQKFSCVENNFAPRAKLLISQIIFQ